MGSSNTWRERLVKKTKDVLTPGQMRELIMAVIAGVPTNLPEEVAQYWIGRKSQLSHAVRNCMQSIEVSGEIPTGRSIEESPSPNFGILEGEESCLVTIDYGVPLSRMIDLGAFRWIRENFKNATYTLPGEGVVKRTITLIPVPRATPAAECLEAVRAHRLRAAVLEELVALGNQYTKMCRKKHIAALGTTVTEGVHNPQYPVIMSALHRGLRLDLAYNWWGHVAGVPME
jgi:hypothetical protein